MKWKWGQAQRAKASTSRLTKKSTSRFTTCSSISEAPCRTGTKSSSTKRLPLPECSCRRISSNFQRLRKSLKNQNNQNSRGHAQSWIRLWNERNLSVTNTKRNGGRYMPNTTLRKRVNWKMHRLGCINGKLACTKKGCKRLLRLEDHSHLLMTFHLLTTAKYQNTKCQMESLRKARTNSEKCCSCLKSSRMQYRSNEWANRVSILTTL